MKNNQINPLTLCLLLVLLPLWGKATQLVECDFTQSNKERAAFYKNMLWNTPQPEFSDTLVPPQWRNESQVMLCSNSEVLYAYYMAKMTFVLVEHSRVKLQDLNAVSRYSEFSFRDNYKSRGWFNKVKATFHVGFKIVKPDGTEHEVDINEAVETNIQQGRKEETMNKIAIPGLEMGDIVDFYYIAEIKFPVSQYYVQDPEFFPLVDEFPIKKQYLTLHIGPSVYLNARSVNGAPKLKLSHENMYFSSYQLVDSMRNKLTDNVHFRMATELPHLKYHGYYVNTTLRPKKPGNVELFMLGDRVKYKDHLHTDDLKELTVFLSKDKSSYWGGTTDVYASYIKATNRYLKSKFDKTQFNQTELVKEAYYFLREYNFRTQLLRIASNGKISPSIYAPPLELFSANHVLATVYKEWGVPFNFVYTVPNSMSKLDDWLFLNELVPLLEVMPDKDTLLIADIGKESFINYLPHDYSGNKAYRINVFDKEGKFLRKGGTMEPIVLKKNTPDDFKSQVNIHMRVTDFSSPVQLNFEYQVKGGEKVLWDTLMVSAYDSYREQRSDYSRYIVSPAIDHSKWAYTMSGLNEYQVQFEEQRRQSVSDFMRLKLGNQSFTLDSIYVNNIGRWEPKPDLEFGYSATATQVCTPIGERYLLDVGSMLGNKFIPTQLEDSVTFDFQTGGPYEVSQTLRISLPAGYQVKDVESLQKHFENECGILHISASYSQGELMVQTRKAAKHRFYPRQKWPAYTAFLNAGVQMAQMQVIVEPQ